jgi:hypothetical protein
MTGDPGDLAPTDENWTGNAEEALPGVYDPAETGGATGKGPFGVEAVDALVYQHTLDNPELRAAAANIRLAPPLEIRDARPARKGVQQFSPWTPTVDGTSDASDGAPGPGRRRMPRPVRIGLLIALTAVPVALVWLFLTAGLALYQR